MQYQLMLGQINYAPSETPQQQAAELRRTSVERSASMFSAGGMGLSNITDRMMNQ